MENRKTTTRIQQYTYHIFTHQPAAAVQQITHQQKEQAAFFIIIHGGKA